ncbi:PHB depolymerase family esterase [Terasakiella sp. A23]|uniref:PHB depolymerase family esterase n=1 Tax=Terasakiella sp. FCG-A23 TaxID=3080561 RepID=UPI0029538230|nr:PHB depolymerase family esterase [Terasakiella sp. A23]MDV7337992.1 PHB depolymerase family esterase [Terasakiella sp. A23]
MRFLSLFASAFLLMAPAWADGPAPKIDSSKVTVSGVSSGAFMAQQLHVAYSDVFSGMGSVAGGPFFCAQNMKPEDIATIKQQCMMGIGADLTATTYIDKANSLAAEGKIAPLTNLKDDKVFIFNSQSDQVINPLLGNASRIFYDQYMSATDIQAWANIPSYGPFYPVAHGMPTTKSMFDKFENIGDVATPCSPSNSQQYSWFPNQFLRGNDPWIYHCNYGFLPGYDLGKDILSHLYGSMSSSKTFKDANLYSFKQKDYVADLSTDKDLNDHGIGTTGYAYVPEACKSGTKDCKLHVALHGCQQFPEWKFKGKIGSSYAGQEITFGDTFYKNVYNDLAESNDIVMLYPQAHNIGTQEADINPYGCWAFWAMADDETHTYYTREGREMKMIANMVDALKNGTMLLSQ